MQVLSENERQMRIKSCKKEPWTVDFIEKCPENSVFIDIGANVGAYTLVAIANGLQVLAVEPAFETYATLCRNLAMNNYLDRALTMCGGVGAVDGMEWMHYSSLASGAASHRFGGQARDGFHKQRIPMWKLDNLCSMFQQPLYLKIDVDGGEMGVLSGGHETLNRAQGVMCELEPAAEGRLVEAMQAHGLTLKELYRARGIAYGWFIRG